jgi:hypothetical protein
MSQQFYNSGNVLSPGLISSGTLNRYKNNSLSKASETSMSPITATVEQTSSTTILANPEEVKQQIEFKNIELMDWQQCDLNHDSERVHYVATYYNKKGKKLLMMGTVLQFAMLILSLSGSYIATFGNFNETSKMILMSCLNLSTAIISGVYTFFSFTKKGQTFTDASNVLFHKIEKIKVAITTLKNDRDYEDMKRSLIESLLKHDIECIREKYNHKHYVPVYRNEVEEKILRSVKIENNKPKMYFEDGISKQEVPFTRTQDIEIQPSLPHTPPRKIKNKNDTTVQELESL